MPDLARRDPFAGGSARQVAEAWTESARNATKTETQADATEGAAPDTEQEAQLGDKPENPFEAPESQEETDEASSETESAKEPGEPAISAPTGWSDGEKAHFAKLPREVQQTIARKDADANRAFTSKTTELADQRKRVEALQSQFQQGLTERFQKLDQLISSMDVKEPDWQVILDSEGVVAFNQKRLAWDQTQKAGATLKAERDRIQSEQEQTQQRNLLAYAETEYRALAEKWPEFTDEVKGKEAKAEVMSYLTSIGFSKGEIDSALDHRIFVVVRDALKYRALQKARPEVEKRLRDAPRMQKAGPSTDRSDRDEEATRKARQMVQRRPGNTKAIAGLLSRHLKP